jgi:hypothetical protein
MAETLEEFRKRNAGNLAGKIIMPCTCEDHSDGELHWAAIRMPLLPDHFVAEYERAKQRSFQ